MRGRNASLYAVADQLRSTWMDSEQLHLASNDFAGPEDGDWRPANQIMEWRQGKISLVVLGAG